MKRPLPQLRDLARQRLLEPSSGQLEKEIEEARKEGYKLIALPGVRIMIRDYKLKPSKEGEDSGDTQAPEASKRPQTFRSGFGVDQKLR